MSRPGRVEVLGVGVDPVTVDGVYAEIRRLVRRRGGVVLNVNAHCLNLCHEDPGLRRFFGAADLIFCDGAGVRLAAAILGIVCAQALRGGANANWAVGAYVPGIVLALAVLAARPWLAGLSLGLGALVALVLPMLATQAETLRMPDGRLLMARYVGQAAISATALAEARRLGAGLIVSDDRALLADLFYRTQARGGMPGVTVRALPTRPADSHYALRYPLTDETGPALWLGRAGHLPNCAGPAIRWTPRDGVARGASLELAPLPAPCLDQIRSIASAIP